MAESEIKNASIALYDHLCKNIVGSEDHVKTLRMMNNVRDNLQSNNTISFITSGSFGEGLNMRGSDLDIMAVHKEIEILEDKHMYLNADNTYFTMELGDTQPGFTKLLLVHSNDPGIRIVCVEIGGDFYFSNLLVKKEMSKDLCLIVHGPCVSDEYGNYDHAYCVHSKVWITPAKQWITRSNNAWPTFDVKQAIVKHGVLFVPVGVKGSTQEDLEWRISFSVGEKLLINSFAHTQLLCYALMKILLKDVIALDADCKELLCSYFIKTILFWICEELPLSIWKPENLISCYMRCFRRLIYCVEYKVCAHYFIPENNLFENKIQGQAHETLLNKLYSLKSYGWQCILLSDQISNLNALTSDINKETSHSYAKSVERLFNSQFFGCDFLNPTICTILEKVIYKVLSTKSSKIISLYTYYLSKFCCSSNRCLPLEDMSCNKSIYKKYNTYISTLLLNTRHDAVYGWLMLASFFYKRKQYNTALHIIQYSLLKFTPEKLNIFMQFSDIHYELFKSHLYRNMTIVQLCKFLLLGLVFINNSTWQPDELQMKEHTLIPSIVYAHFLCFLCHYHLKNSRQCWDSLRDLQLTIEQNYLIATRTLKAFSYNVLGTCFQILGDIEAARQVFMHSIGLFPDQKINAAFQKLSLMS
ncbi:Hypothetical predicted protein [Mytilus galloprovincialis]|uniref:Mab-21-like HhH/H2TH-like domain-containing protein n=1 Tax=Mytilus galloprovincialis TaxID=29158 RepID=A0A8B6CH54_MYTGA|nr:Hypothetical predicted protein [Mytilus galloprovincialis]